VTAIAAEFVTDGPAEVRETVEAMVRAERDAGHSCEAERGRDALRPN
jgi:hypothetical protein